MGSIQLYFSFFSLILLALMSGSSFAVDIEAGRVKSTQCAICHGENGEGNGAPKSKISGLDVELFKRHMNAYKKGERRNVMMERFCRNLSEQDIENLAAYYASL